MKMQPSALRKYEYQVIQLSAPFGTSMSPMGADELLWFLWKGTRKSHRACALQASNICVFQSQTKHHAE